LHILFFFFFFFFIGAWYPFPPASHRHFTIPGVGLSSEVAAYPFLMLDFHQLASMSFAWRA
ncbi:MAG: hypothetical protein J5U17_11675, partial [Candidatus Methanoperedens sp.]|nr:hypothetical protein [Candidatus Methanoperedens sp.]